MAGQRIDAANRRRKTDAGARRLSSVSRIRSALRHSRRGGRQRHHGGWRRDFVDERIFRRSRRQIVAASETAARATGFAIHRVTLRGARSASHQEVLDALAINVGDSILHVDLADARTRVEALGWVKAAAVSRLLPGVIHVSVREREPSAVWQLNGRLTLIDQSGAEIKNIGAHEYAHLPMIVGVGAPGAAADVLAALSERPTVAKLTYALVRVGERRWNIRLRNGIDVKLPEAGFEASIEALEVLETGGGLLDQEIEFIDLRDPDRVVLRERTADAR